MADSPASKELTEQAQHLYRRLLAGDPTAPNDLAELLLEPLTAWLAEHNPRCSTDLLWEAAEDALLSLFHNPAAYDPQQLGLEAYLHMAAQRDLQNRLRREDKHQEGRVSLNSVEQSPDCGKYLGRTDEPELSLESAELQALAQTALERLRGQCNEEERKVLELWQQGEKRTAIFAAACGQSHLPLPEQQRYVKRIKDRLKARLKRERNNDAGTA